MRKTCVAETDEHQKLLDEGWRPVFASQVLEYKEQYHKTMGYFLGHNLEPKSKLFVIMEKADA